MITFCAFHTVTKYYTIFGGFQQQYDSSCLILCDTIFGYWYIRNMRQYITVNAEYESTLENIFPAHSHLVYVHSSIGFHMFDHILFTDQDKGV